MYRITVPREFSEDREFERVIEAEFEDAPRGTKFRLELSSATKFGLEGGPIGTTLGLELLEARVSGPEGTRDGVCDTTVLIVGTALGRLLGSSSEYAATEP